MARSAPFKSTALVPNARARRWIGFFAFVAVGGLVSSSIASAATVPVPRLRVPASAATGGVLPMAVAVGDVNGDGKADVVAANEGPVAFKGSVGVALGSGAGSIAPAVVTVLPSGWGACDVAVAELTGDAQADVVALGCVTSSAGPIFVLKATGGGALTLVQTLPNSLPGHLALADLGGDGHADLLFSATGTAQVRVYKGLAGGTFAPPTTSSPPQDSYHIAVGDVTGDGRPDLVGADGGPVWVMAATPGGALGPQIITASPQLQAYNVAVGQFDADGKLDVATVDASGGHLFIGLGTGDGHFVPGVSFDAVADQALWVTTGDFTGDGRTDIVTNGERQNANVSALFAGVGDGTFRAPVRRVTGSIGLTAANLDGKGGSDLVAFRSDSGVLYATVQKAGSLKAALVDPNGLLGVPADVNGDGQTDVVWAAGGLVDGSFQSVIVARLGTGSATFAAPITSKIRDETFGSGATSIAVADLNGDGKLDVAGGFDNFEANAKNLFVALGDGTGRFGPATQLSSGDTPADIQSVALTDVTGDGRPDIVSHTRSQISVLPGLGGTAFGPPVISGSSGFEQVSTLVGDVTGDGIPDVAAVLLTGGEDFGSGEVRVNRGIGNGTFTLAQTITFDSNPTGGVLADLSGDGRPDVAVVGAGGFDGGRNGLFVLLDTAGGTLAAPTYYPRGVSGITVGDFNRDGFPDLTSDAIDGGTELDLNDGSGHFTQVVTVVAAGHVSLSADLNGDGRIDIVAGSAVDINLTP